MPHLKQILFPVDFSNPCERAADRVAALAEHFNAGLTLLHAASIPFVYGVTTSARLYSALRKEVLAASRTAIETFAAKHFGSINSHGIIEEGEPGRVIADYAHEHKVDLIMMPTHGRGGFRRFLTGSVTSQVLHDSLCPVWTFAHSERRLRPTFRKPQNILCAVDRGSEAVPLMRWASWFARHYQATVKLVHVVPALNETSRNCGEVELRRYFVRIAREEFAVLKDRAGFRGRLIIRGGSIPARLADTVRQEQSDLLVVGRGQTRKALGRLRTHSLAIIRESPCPVISV